MAITKGPTVESGVPEFVNFRAKLKKSENSSILENASTYTASAGKSDRSGVSAAAQQKTMLSKPLPVDAPSVKNIEEYSSTFSSVEINGNGKENNPISPQTEQEPASVGGVAVFTAPIKVPEVARARATVTVSTKKVIEPAEGESFADARKRLQKSANSNILENPSKYTTGGSNIDRTPTAVSGQLGGSASTPAVVVASTKAPEDVQATKALSSPERRSIEEVTTPAVEESLGNARERLQKSASSKILENPSTYTTGGSNVDKTPTAAPDEQSGSAATPVVAAPTKAPETVRASAVLSSSRGININDTPAPVEEESLADARKRLQKSASSKILENPSAYTTGESNISSRPEAESDKLCGSEVTPAVVATPTASPEVVLASTAVSSSRATSIKEVTTSAEEESLADARKRLQKSASSKILENPSVYTTGRSSIDSPPTAVSDKLGGSVAMPAVVATPSRAPEVVRANAAVGPSRGRSIKGVATPVVEESLADARKRLQKSANSKILENPSAYTTGGSNIDSTLTAACSRLGGRAMLTKEQEVGRSSASPSTPGLNKVVNSTTPPSWKLKSSAANSGGLARPYSSYSTTKAKKPLPKGPTDENCAPEYASFRSKLRKSVNSSVLDNPTAYTSGGSKLSNSTVKS